MQSFMSETLFDRISRPAPLKPPQTQSCKSGGFTVLNHDLSAFFDTGSLHSAAMHYLRIPLIASRGRPGSSAE